ncbi:hypothetical protein Pan44_10250 [Caulifigura coniformis]|uniref:Uncharacterized protein n=1 Tax=Caulifigura coniformis TaxID=2527983 RepID=A0A517SA53_9PLAN|nr:hypothetical protein [Caulifigura coniformis]QDT53010.1 hypothetical protein Pan44_10250 [Caulifigura coniformis]
MRAAVERLAEDCSQLETVFQETVVESWKTGGAEMVESAFRTLPITEARAVMADNLLNAGWEASASRPERKALKEFATLIERIAQLVQIANTFTAAETDEEKRLRCKDTQAQVAKFRTSLADLTKICEAVEKEAGALATPLTGIADVDQHNQVTTDEQDLWLSRAQVAVRLNRTAESIRRKVKKLEIEPAFREGGQANGKTFYRLGDLLEDGRE